MKKTPSTQSFLTLGKDPMRSKDNVELTNIASELKNLWEDLEGSSKIRACLFNLIIYTDEAARIPHFEELMHLVIEKLPCRIIFIKGTPGVNQLKTSVSAVVTGKGDQMIACDRITIDAGGEYLDRVPFIVLPHIVPDLPVYLVWGRDPSVDHTILPHLQKFATRVIFDSECSKDVQTFAQTVRARVKELNCEVADLNWAAIRGWRDALSQTFNTPDRIIHLANSKKIVISYNQEKTPVCQNTHVQALYLQGWLAGRLNWRYDSVEWNEEAIRIYYHNTMDEMTVRLQPVKAPGTPPGSIQAVEIESYEQHYYSISRDTSNRTVRVEISSPDHCEIPYSLMLSSLTRGQGLMKEIFYEPASEHYLSMLKVISELEHHD